MRAVWVSFAIASAAMSADAATTRLALARALRGAATLSLARIDTAADVQRQKPAEQRRAVDLGALPALDLAAGHWSIAVEGDGVWHARQYFSVEGDSEHICGLGLPVRRQRDKL